MIYKNSTSIKQTMHGGVEYHSAYKDGHLTYSAYVVMGTCYYSQTLTITSASPTHTWTVEVLGIAGTDDTGNYYRFGIRDELDDNGNEGSTWQDMVVRVNSIQKALADMALLRSIYRMTYSPYNLATPFFVSMRSNTHIRVFDALEAVLLRSGVGSLINQFTGCVNLRELVNIHLIVCLPQCSFESTFRSLTSLSHIDFRGNATLYNVQKWQDTFNSSQISSILMDMQPQDNPNTVNISAIIANTPLTLFEFGKLRIKIVSNCAYAFLGCRTLEGVTGLQGIKLTTGCSVVGMFQNCVIYSEDPHIETWTGIDGISKPVVNMSSSNSMVYNFGENVPIANRFDLDFNGWGIMVGASAILSFYGCKHNVKNVENISFISTEASTVISLNMAFQGTTISRFATTKWADNIPFSISSVGSLFKNNTAITEIDVTGISWMTATVTSTGSTAEIFTGCVNVTSYKSNYNFYNVLTDYSPVFNLSPMTSWTDSTEIAALITSLANNVNRNYTTNNIVNSIQFNAVQQAVIEAIPNWATLASQIAINGWNIIFPVTLNNEQVNINMSDM